MSNATERLAPDIDSIGATTAANDRARWNNPYLLGSAALFIIAVLSLGLSLLLVCRRLHQFPYCSLFLIEMAVGSLTTEAIVHLLPSLILTENPRGPNGMPVYFPRLATVTALVCVQHLLDTASVVFFGRSQSTSHALEWRNSQQNLQHNTAADPAAQTDRDRDSADEGSIHSTTTVTFEDDDVADGGGRSRSVDVTLKQAVAHPRVCLQPGPYRLCSIMSAGSVLHSFANGVAIGAAFVHSWESGLHLSLSVGMHELAHKGADFAVLTASGFSLTAVVLLNLCYWTSAFIGLFVSVPLSQKSELLRAWIMTIATAVYVYISLVTMSSMVRRNYLPHHTSAFLIGNAGMTTGYLLIMIASTMELLYR